VWDKNIEKHWNGFECYMVQPDSNLLITLIFQTSSGPTKIIQYQSLMVNFALKWANLDPLCPTTQVD